MRDSVLYLGFVTRELQIPYKNLTFQFSNETSLIIFENFKRF